MTNLIDINLETLTASELKNLAKAFRVKNWWNLKKADLITELTNLQMELKNKVTPPETQEELTSMPDTEDHNEEAAEEPKKKASKKAPKTPKVKKNEENLVTLKELAAEFHMKGTKARRLLRNETAARPFGGNRWEWDKDLHQKELELAKSILKAHTK